MTWVKEKERPVDVLNRLWAELKLSGIRCKLTLLDRYFFTVPVLKWLQQHDLPFIVPVVIRGRKPKPGKSAKGLRGQRGQRAGSYSYTHHAGTQSVTFRLVINYKTYRHHRTKKRAVKKMLFATWKVNLTPTEVRETYRSRFGIETSYRQLNQSRARTSSRDPLYRLLLVGLSLFLRNLWQWLVHLAHKSKNKAARSGSAKTSGNPVRYQDILDDFSVYFREQAQHQSGSPVRSPMNN